MRKTVAIAFNFCIFTLQVFCADAEYKLVRIQMLTNAMRVHLPRTEVTGKVRVKEKSSDGFGLPVASMKTLPDKNYYLEWQIGYEIASTNSPTVVTKIRFIRNGETKYATNFPKLFMKPFTPVFFQRTI